MCWRVSFDVRVSSTLRDKQNMLSIKGDLVGAHHNICRCTTNFYEEIYLETPSHLRGFFFVHGSSCHNGGLSYWFMEEVVHWVLQQVRNLQCPFLLSTESLGGRTDPLENIAWPGRNDDMWGQDHLHFSRLTSDVMDPRKEFDQSKLMIPWCFMGLFRTIIRDLLFNLPKGGSPKNHQKATFATHVASFEALLGQILQFHRAKDGVPMFIGRANLKHLLVGGAPP